MHGVTRRQLHHTAIVILGTLGAGLAQAQPATTTFSGSIVAPPTPTGPGQNATQEVSPGGLTRNLTLHFSLKNPNTAELEQRVMTGQIPSKAEVVARYSGDKQGAQLLDAWLKEQGIKRTTITPDNGSLYAIATVDQVHRSLQVDFQSIVLNGQRVVSAATPPKLPDEIASHVLAIDGLQPWVQAQKQLITRQAYLISHPAPGARKASIVDETAPSTSAYIPRPASINVPPLLVPDLVKRYDVPSAALTGRGQTIAVLIDTFPLRSDLALFWKRNGLKVHQSRIKFVNLRGPAERLPPIEGEESLDVQWASGMAPGARVIVYATGSLDWAALDRGLDQILADAAGPNGPTQLSISLGLREDLVSPDEIRAEHARFVRLLALGVSIFVSSGDAGSNPDASGHAHGPDSQVEYPASDSATIAVGGTSLDKDSAGTAVETCWPESGGGVSARGLAELTRPAWQASYSGIDSPMRLVPDVSSLADPIPGALVVQNGLAAAVGGTSWSAPVWAAFGALLAEQRSRPGHPTAGLLAQQLYAAQKLGGLREVSVNSDGTYPRNGAFQCGPAWNPVTGLGVPSVRRLSEVLQGPAAH